MYGIQPYIYFPRIYDHNRRILPLRYTGLAITVDSFDFRNFHKK